MNTNRKKGAIKLLNEQAKENATADDLKEILINAEGKDYTSDEIEEILQEYSAQAAPAEKPKAKPVNANGYVPHDKWMVQCDSVPVSDDSAQAEYKILYVKMLRANRPITVKTAAELNAQTQNNSVRYVPAGTKTNGDEDTITVNRGKNR